MDWIFNFRFAWVAYPSELDNTNRASLRISVNEANIERVLSMKQLLYIARFCLEQKPRVIGACCLQARPDLPSSDDLGFTTLSDVTILHGPLDPGYNFMRHSQAPDTVGSFFLSFGRRILSGNDHAKHAIRRSRQKRISKNSDNKHHSSRFCIEVVLFTHCHSEFWCSEWKLTACNFSYTPSLRSALSGRSSRVALMTRGLSIYTIL